MDVHHNVKKKTKNKKTTPKTAVLLFKDIYMFYTVHFNGLKTRSHQVTAFSCYSLIFHTEYNILTVLIKTRTPFFKHDS